MAIQYSPKMKNRTLTQEDTMGGGTAAPTTPTPTMTPTPTPTPTSTATGMAPRQQAVNPVETQDYRDLLNAQIMTESGKAQASKYLTAAMQASGVAQTGLSQSVLSGLEMGYQGQLAQNINEYNIAKESREFEAQQGSQSRASELAFTFLDSATSEDQLQEYYDAYYNQLSPQDQQAFDLYYGQRQRELAGTGSEAILSSFVGATETPEYTSITPDVNNWIEFLNVQTDGRYKNSSPDTRTAANELKTLIDSSSAWGSTRNGATYKIIDPQGNEVVIGYRNGKWYTLQDYTGTVIKTFTLKE